MEREVRESPVSVIEYPNPASAPEPTGVEKEAADAAEAGESEAPVVEEPAVVAEEPKSPPVSRILLEAKERETQAERKLREAKEVEQRAKDLEEQFSVDSIKKAPTKFLAKLGISLQDLAEATLAEGQPEPEETDGQKALREVEKLKKEKADEETRKQKAQAENEQAYINEAIANHTALAIKMIGEDTEGKYELIKAFERPELVTEIVVENWKQNGTMLDIKEALELAENYFLTQTEKAFGTSKVKQKFVPEVKEPEKLTRSLSRTLTNSMASETDVNVSGSGQRLSRDEKLKVLSKKLIVRPD